MDDGALGGILSAARAGPDRRFGLRRRASAGSTGYRVRRRVLTPPSASASKANVPGSGTEVRRLALPAMASSMLPNPLPPVFENDTEVRSPLVLMKPTNPVCEVGAAIATVAEGSTPLVAVTVPIISCSEWPISIGHSSLPLK